MVFFKYLIRFLRRHYFKFFVLLGIFIMFLFVFGLYNNVFGFTNWTAPNNKTYRIPDYTVPSGEKFITYVRQNKNNNYFRVFYFHTNGDYVYLQPNSNGYNFKVRSLPYNSSTEVFNGTYTYTEQFYESQSLPGNSTFTSTSTNTVSNYSATWNTNTYDYFVYDGNFDLNVYTTNPVKNDFLNTFYDYQEPSVDPYIENSSTDIEDWSFDNLSINLGTLEFNENDVLIFTYNNVEYSLFLKDYVETVGAGNITNPISIPVTALNNYIVFTENADITFEYGSIIGTGNVLKYDMGTYSVTLTTTKVNELNNNADRNIQNAILDKTEETNQQLQDLNNSINDDNIDVTANDLPSIDVNNPTENGLNNIFQNLYNAFCTGQAQDIVFPIPFTNKNITLSPYYVRDMLNNNNASWVYTFIQAFWGYLIGRYIIKDITSKIDKIKSGDVENVENSNIKEDML